MLYAIAHSELFTQNLLADGHYPNGLNNSSFCGLQRSKYKSLKVRAGSTVVIIASFIIVIYLGHVPLMVMILAIQVLSSAFDVMHLRVGCNHEADDIGPPGGTVDKKKI